MPANPQLVLDQFPVELIFDVFSFLTAGEILYSFYNFSRYLRQCIRTYTQYKVNFQSIHRHEFDRICNVIHPAQIIALTLSDNEETPGQIAHFFTRFPTFDQTFSRLEHFRIQNVDETHTWRTMKSLQTLTIDFKRWSIYSFDFIYIKQCTNILIDIFQLSNLHSLILNCETLKMDFDFNILPIAAHLHRFKTHLTTTDQLPIIFKRLPNIQQLSLNLTIQSLENDIISNFNAPSSLTHLTIRIKYGSQENIQQIIQMCTMLTYLNIHIDRHQRNVHQWLDGNWWQSLISQYLPQLKIFHLTVDLASSTEWTTTKGLLESFQTPFWMDTENSNRSFTATIIPSYMSPIVTIDLSFNETSVLSTNRFSNVKTLQLKHESQNDERYVVSDLAELERHITDLSTLIHLQLQDTCTITPSLFNQLLTIAPYLTRLTITSSHGHLDKLIQLAYPQIRWLDMRRQYLSSHMRTQFCSAFPCLQHLFNCHVYSEEDLEVLLENLKYLQNITVHIQSYYFDDNDEFEQWLRKHSHLTNFTFNLLNERQIQLWISNRHIPNLNR